MWSYLIDHYQTKACFVESGGWPWIEIPGCIQVELKIANDNDNDNNFIGDTITDNSVVYFVVRNNNIDKKWKLNQ